MTRPDDLIEYIFKGQPHLLNGSFVQWLEASPRFAGFVETYRDKIRKKVRVTREVESVLNLRCELELAYRLLNERRLELVYEPYASARVRGPDYAVTYRENTVFNIEVSRIRVVDRAAEKVDVGYQEERMRRILMEKLGQMQPGMPNLLVICTTQELAQSIDLGRLMNGVKIRADGRDPAFYGGSRYSGPSAFYKDFLHLSGILVWASGVHTWTNKQARPGLDEKPMRLVAGLLGGN